MTYSESKVASLFTLFGEWKKLTNTAMPKLCLWHDGSGHIEDSMGHRMLSFADLAGGVSAVKGLIDKGRNQARLDDVSAQLLERASSLSVGLALYEGESTRTLEILGKRVSVTLKVEGS